MADISAPYNEIIRRRIEGAGVPQTKGGALAQGLGMVPQKVQGTTLEELQTNSLNNVFGFPEIGFKDLTEGITKGLGMFSGEGGRLPAPMLDAALSATKYLTSPSAAAKAIADEGIIDNSIFEATDLPNITFERKPGESRDDFKDRFLETDPKFEKGKTTIKPGTEGLPKKRIPVDVKADPLQNREPKTMYDMPSEPVPDADPAEQLFSQAMSEYISQARTGAEDDLPKIGDIEDYKKKFAEATGVDISGKPDTSQALMAMGLSMMQNRAGKGFNVGKMLSAVGEAGEKALPALTAAKAEARNNVIAAGKYALTAQDADEKTRKAAEKDLLNRGKYWVFKKGGKDGEFSNFENGEFVDLNKAEMNKLITDPKFDEQYSFVDATTRFDILAKRAEGQELGEMWGKKPEAISLIGGAAKDVPAELQVFGTYANPNYSGKATSRIKLSEEPQAVINRFLSYQDGIDKGTVKFKELLTNIDAGISIGEQFLSSANQFFINLGLDRDTSTVAKAKQALSNFAIDEATNILKESGKTLSDGDRRLVKERVGQINWSNADPQQIKRQINDVYDLVIIKSQKNLDTAVAKLESDFGIAVRPTTQSGPKDQAELDEFNETYGRNFTMETFPKD